MIDGIIFDIDGTIWDSRDVVTRSWNAALREHTDFNITLDAEEVGSHFGKPMEEIFRCILPQNVQYDTQALMELMYNYEHHYLDMYPPVPYGGIPELIESLSQKYKLFIVTNAQKGYIEKLFIATGLCRFFTDWLCHGDTNAPKDVTIRKIIERNNLKAPVYIGDTQGDANSCEKAGVPMIFVSYGLGTVENPRFEANSVDEIPKILDRVNDEVYTINKTDI